MRAASLPIIVTLTAVTMLVCCGRPLGSWEAPVELCGNGIIDLEAGEECDDGNVAPLDGCNTVCRIEQPFTCGNGILDVGEHCDDGNHAVGDGCDPDCRLEWSEGCGNGVLDPGEECDDANHEYGDGCAPNCRREIGGPVGE